MGRFREIKSLPSKDQRHESIHINFNSGIIKCIAARYIFKDKETGQYVTMVPSLDITGYGDTKDKAFEMLNFCMDDLFKHLIDQSPKKVEAILKELGWTHNRYKNKEYSKAYVDASGELKEFAVENLVEVEVASF